MQFLKFVKFVLPAIIVFVAFVLTSPVSYGTIEYGKKEKKPCTTCHIKVGEKELNDAGKYYEKKKTLEGYTK
jgi:hypothetical protein